MPKTAAEVLVETPIRPGDDRCFCVLGEAIRPSRIPRSMIRRSTWSLPARDRGGLHGRGGRQVHRPGVVFASRGPGATNACVAVHSARRGRGADDCDTGPGRHQTAGHDAYAADQPRHDLRRHGETSRRSPKPRSHRRDYGVYFPTSPCPCHARRPDEIAAAAAPPAEAERPVLLAGEHTGGDRDVLAQAAEAYQVFIMPVFKPEDVFDHEHPLYAEELDIRSPTKVRHTTWDADVVIAVGTRPTGVPSLAYTTFRAIAKPSSTSTRTRPKSGFVFLPTAPSSAMHGRFWPASPSATPISHLPAAPPGSRERIAPTSPAPLCRRGRLKTASTSPTSSMP